MASGRAQRAGLVEALGPRHLRPDLRHVRHVRPGRHRELGGSRRRTPTAALARDDEVLDRTTRWASTCEPLATTSPGPGDVYDGKFSEAAGRTLLPRLARPDAGGALSESRGRIAGAGVAPETRLAAGLPRRPRRSCSTDRRFEEWLDLLDRRHPPTSRRSAVLRKTPQPDVVDDIGSSTTTSPSLTLRVRRLRTDVAWAEDPPSFTRRFVTNFRFEPGEDDDELRVRELLLLYRSRGDGGAHDLIVRRARATSCGRRGAAPASRRGASSSTRRRSARRTSGSSCELPCQRRPGPLPGLRELRHDRARRLRRSTRRPASRSC